MILNSGNRILKISTHFGISTLISERSFHSSFCLRMNEKKTTFADNNRKVESILNKGKIKIFEIMSIYEEAIGLKEIKDAQNQVLEVRNEILNTAPMNLYRLFINNLVRKKIYRRTARETRFKHSNN